MRVAIFSDVHAHPHALDAVLAEVKRQGIRPEHCYLLGDLVGYNMRPEECVQRVKAEGINAVVGNHDIGVLRMAGVNPPTDLHLGAWGASFNDNAHVALRYTSYRLTPDSLEFLASLPFVMDFDHSLALHNTLHEPTYFDTAYAYGSRELARATFGVMEHAREFFDKADDTRLCFVGHSHTPGYITKKCTLFRSAQAGKKLRVSDPKNRYIIDVGAVSRSRDKDPRSSYVVYDGKEVVYHRAPA